MPVPVPRQRDTPATESGQAVLTAEPPLAQATGQAAAEATAQATTHTTPLTLLVIEDDPAGGLTVPEILDTDGHRIRLRTARNLTEAARLLTPDVHCILLDLALPDTGPRTASTATAADQLDNLRQVLRIAPATPSSSSPPRRTPSAAPRPSGSAPRTSSSGTSWTAGC